MLNAQLDILPFGGTFDLSGVISGSGAHVVKRIGDAVNASEVVGHVANPYEDSAVEGGESVGLRISERIRSNNRFSSSLRNRKDNSARKMGSPSVAEGNAAILTQSFSVVTSISAPAAVAARRRSDKSCSVYA